MKVKTVTIDGKNYAELDGEKPIFVHPDGKEAAFDVPDMYARLLRDGRRNSDLQKEFETVNERLKSFDGIDDAEAARKALDTIKNLSAGDLVKADKVEEIKLEARKAAEKQVADAAKASGEKLHSLEKQLADLSTMYDGEKVTNAFAGSQYLKDKIGWPPDVVQKMFGSQLKREEGRLVGYDPSGNKMYSGARPGELANVDEVIEALVSASPHRDQMLKGANQTGSGARLSNGNAAGGNTMTMAKFNTMTPAEQGNLMASKTPPALVDG